MRALKEMAGVVATGLLAFFGGIAFALGAMLLWACGLASVLCLGVAAFAGVMYGLTRRPHDAQIALVYLGYAALPFMLTFAAGFYRSKLSQGRRQRAHPS
jgi:hypothetical protein